jgi:hypothetical protein
VFPHHPSNKAHQLKTYYREVKDDLQCEQSVNNIPTIVNGHLNYNNLHLASDSNIYNESNASNLVMESEMEMNVNKTKDIRGLKHKILIIGDSHVRGYAGIMSASMDACFKVCGVIKPGSCTDSISGTMSDEVDKLTKNDFLVLSSGANDINNEDMRIAFRNIINYVKNISRTNVILIGVPYRYDNRGCSQLNNSIKLFKNKLSKLSKIFSHVTISKLISNRLLYTKHGSHLNSLSKEILSNQLVSKIFLLLERVKVKLIILEWYNKDKLIILEWYNKETLLVAPSIDKPSLTQTKNQHSIKRNRKLPITRNKDFLWNIYITQMMP